MCQEKNPSSCQPPFCLTHLFLSYSTTHLILQGFSWVVISLGLGEYGQPSILAGLSSLTTHLPKGKVFIHFTLTWKREATILTRRHFSSSTHVLHFPHKVEAWRAIFLKVFGLLCSSFIILCSWEFFSPIIHPRWGSLNLLGASYVWHSHLSVVCVVSLTWATVFFIFPSWKSFLVIPNELEKTPQIFEWLLSCFLTHVEPRMFCEVNFGHRDVIPFTVVNFGSQDVFVSYPELAFCYVVHPCVGLAK